MKKRFPKKKTLKRIKEVWAKVFWKKHFIFFPLLFLFLGGVYLYWPREISIKPIREIPNDFDYSGAVAEDIYTILHFPKDFESFAGNTKSVIREMNLDFEHHSYLVTYGRRAKSAHHSPFRTLLFRQSVKYLSPKGKTYVRIESEEGDIVERAVFVYQLKRNTNLGSFHGIMNPPDYPATKYKQAPIYLAFPSLCILVLGCIYFFYRHQKRTDKYDEIR